MRRSSPSGRPRERQTWMVDSLALMRSSGGNITDLFIPLTSHLRNISIGNNYTVEEPAYLKMKGISHVLNTCGKESEPDTARVNPFHFQNNGLQHLSLEVR